MHADTRINKDTSTTSSYTVTSPSGENVAVTTPDVEPTLAPLTETTLSEQHSEMPNGFTTADITPEQFAQFLLSLPRTGSKGENDIFEGVQDLSPSSSPSSPSLYDSTTLLPPSTTSPLDVGSGGPETPSNAGGLISFNDTAPDTTSYYQRHHHQQHEQQHNYHENITNVNSFGSYFHDTSTTSLPPPSMSTAPRASEFDLGTFYDTSTDNADSDAGVDTGIWTCPALYDGVHTVDPVPALGRGYISGSVGMNVLSSEDASCATTLSDPGQTTAVVDSEKKRKWDQVGEETDVKNSKRKTD